MSAGQRGREDVRLVEQPDARQESLGVGLGVLDDLQLVGQGGELLGHVLVLEQLAFEQLFALCREVFEPQRNGRESDVLGHGQVVEQVEVLEHHAHVAAVFVDDRARLAHCRVVRLFRRCVFGFGLRQGFVEPLQFRRVDALFRLRFLLLDLGVDRREPCFEFGDDRRRLFARGDRVLNVFFGDAARLLGEFDRGELCLGRGVFEFGMSVQKFFFERRRFLLVRLDLGRGFARLQRLDLRLDRVQNVLFGLHVALEEHRSVHRDDAARRQFEQVEAAQERALAAARRTDDRDLFADADVAVYAFENIFAPEALGQPAGGDEDGVLFHSLFAHLASLLLRRFSSLLRHSVMISTVTK